MLATTLAVISLLWGSQGASATPNPPALAVASRVFKSNGEPAVGATYYLVVRSDYDAAFVAEKGQVSSNGLLSVDFSKAKGLQPISLVVRCKGQGLFFTDLALKNTPSEIHLPAAATAKISLKLPNGDPARNISVVPTIIVGGQTRQDRAFLFFPPDLASEFAVRTDENGVCTFLDMPLGKRMRFDVTDERFDHVNYGEQITLTKPFTEGKPVKLSLGASISGHLTLDGKPVPHIIVAAQGFPAGGWGNTKTDDAGAFRISRLGKGPYNVSPDLKPPLSDQVAGRAKEVVLNEAEAKTGVELKLEKGAVITGIVKDGKGKPVTDVGVGIYGPYRPNTGGWVQSGQTDATGTYRLRVPAGVQYVYVMVGDMSNKTVKVSEGDKVTVDFQISRPKGAATFNGVVTDAQGKPVPNANVEIMIDGEVFDQHFQKFVSDPQGKFTFVRPGEAKKVSVFAFSAGLGTDVPAEPVDGQDVHVTVKPNQMASAYGEVVDAMGKPIAGAEVKVDLFATEVGYEVRSVKTNAKGKFTVKDLYPLAKYCAFITAPGYGQAQVNSLTPLPSESVNLKLFRLPKADSFLAGIVKDPKGSLVAGAFVGVEDMAVPPATTDTSGHFRINGVPKGNHRIYINKGSEIRNLELMAGKDGQVLILKSDFPTEPPSGTAEPAEKGLEVGGRAVEFETGAWLNSKPLRMSELRGKVVVLDFWGISCAPCVKALPGVERMAKRFAGQQVVVIGVHDCTTNAKLLSAFSKKKGLTYALTIDKGTVKDGFGKTCSKYKIAGTPAIIVIDKQGKIVGMPDSPERAEQMINHLLH